MSTLKFTQIKKNFHAFVLFFSAEDFNASPFADELKLGRNSGLKGILSFLPFICIGKRVQKQSLVPELLGSRTLKLTY